MFILQNEINNYPFTESSTLVLNNSGYTLPKDLFIDACVYPRCENNAPFYINKIAKWVWTVADAAGNTVFTIDFPDTREAYLKNYYIGYCFDSVGPCGTVLGTTGLYNWLRSIPLSQELSMDSLVFSASTVRPVGAKNKKSALIVRKQGNGMPVVNLSWEGKITIDSSGSATVPEKIEYPDEGEDTPITTLVVNGRSVNNRIIHIVPEAGSKVRVLTKSDIRIGKVTEL